MELSNGDERMFIRNMNGAIDGTTHTTTAHYYSGTILLNKYGQLPLLVEKRFFFSDLNSNVARLFGGGSLEENLKTILLGVTRSVGRPIVSNVAHSIGRGAPDRLSYV